MKIFLKRLYKTISYILSCLITFAIYIGLVLAIFSDNPTIKAIVNVIEWIVITPIVLMLLFAIGYFIYWLFVEPFKKNK